MIDLAPSSDVSAIRHLTPEQQQHLSQLLERYLIGLEGGQRETPEQLAAGRPELVEPLRTYIDGLNCLHQLGAAASGDPLVTPTARPDWNGQALGDYQLDQRIGEGGMGVVYRAHQVSLDRVVAIKLLPLGPLSDDRQIARFRNEAQAAACLSHPHIVPVYEVGLERGVHYYAMQFIDGYGIDEMLFQHAQRHELPNWRTMTDLAIQAAEALHAAHEMGVIHRDIKPSNLLVDQSMKLWVTDFGLARYHNDLSLTWSGDIVGTMRYMSPEQARGEAALVDGRTDVYSLAATLYEMLTLQAVHDADDAPSLLRLIDRQQPIPLRRLRGELPRSLETVIAKALSTDRDQRYATAREFADDLKSAAAGRPTIAQPPTILDRSVAWISKHRRSAAVAALIGSLGAVGFAISFLLVAAEKRQSDLNALRAQRHEQLARDAVDRLGNQMAELLADIPSAVAVRQQLLAETLQYHQSFLAYARHDPLLREDLAMTLGKIGVLKGELQQGDAAVEALRESERLYARLAKNAVGQTNLWLDWSVSQSNLARGLHRVGHLEESAQWYGRAIRTQNRLLAERPDDATRTRLAESMNNLGLLLADSGAGDEAAEAYLQAIDLLDDKPPFDDQESRIIAALHTNVSAILAQDDAAGSIRHARAALTHQTHALDRDPHNARLASDTMATLNRLGSSYAATGNHRGAIDALRQAIDIGRQLRWRFPQHPQYRHDLGISQNQLGLSLSAVGLLRDARSAFQNAIVHLRVLASRFQSNAEIQSTAGSVLNNLGHLHQQLGDSEAARDSFLEAVRFQSQATELSPNLSLYQQRLKQHQERLGELDRRS